MNKTKKFIEKLELDLLSTLFGYVVPFINNKIKKPQKTAQRPGNLENLVNSEPKINIRDIRELELLLVKHLNENVKVNKSIGIGKNDIFYSLNLKRQKNNIEKSSKYSVSIKYEENQQEDKLRVKIQKDEKEFYSSEIVNKKDARDKVIPYSVNISYEDGYSEERLSVAYKQQLKNYMQKHIEDKEDTTNRVPLKWLNILPESLMGGVLGFTYLGENFMGRRADLTGKTARMVDIHESIHTPDEYETVCLTRWIMSKERSKYIK